MCCVCNVHESRAEERASGFVVMGVSVILPVQARNRPHADVFGFKF